MAKPKSKLGFIIRLCISAVLLVLIFSFVDIEQIKDVFSRISYPFFLLVTLLVFADRLMMAFKWQRLVLIKQIDLSFSMALIAYLVSGFVGVILPTGVGADIYRIHYTAKLFGGLRHIASSVVIERLLGTTASTIFAVLGITVMSVMSIESKIDELILLQIFLVLAVINIVFFISMTRSFSKLLNYLLKKIDKYRVKKIILSFNQAYQEYGYYKSTLFVFFVLSFIEQIFFVLITYFSALAIGVNIEWYYYIGIVPICQILKRIPISINSIGVQEGLFAYFFTQVGMSVAEALSLSILIRIAQWIIFLIGGVLYVLDSKVKINVDSLQNRA